MYGISKLCENQWSRVLAQQLAPRHIAVFAVCPG
jgi:NAD(P)-dependent dehydrogenase (short-subunit alcohol dehydrogenase family)